MTTVGILTPSSFQDKPNFRRRIGQLHYCPSITLVQADLSDSYDVLIANENSDLTSLMSYNKSPIVFDSINAYALDSRFTFANYFRCLYKYLSGIHSSPFISYNRLLNSIFSHSTHVVTVSYPQQKYITNYNQNSSIILDSFDELSHISKFDYRLVSPGTLNLFWEGQSASLSPLLCLNKLVDSYTLPFKLRLHIVSDEFMPSRLFSKIYTSNYLRSQLDSRVDICFYKWSTSNLSKAISCSDLGFIPLDTSIIHQSKPPNKPLLMSYVGLPVIASESLPYSLLKRRLSHLPLYNDVYEMQNLLVDFYHSYSLRKTVATSCQKFARSFSSSANISNSWLALLNSITNK